MSQISRTDSTRKKWRFWMIAAFVIGLIAIAVTCALFADAASREEMRAITIEPIDFSTLTDGTYIGAYHGKKGNLRDATIEVTVLNGELTNFCVLKGAIDDQGLPTDLGQGLTISDLFLRVQEAKSLQVDAISGATLTCKAHLKALENALLQAQESPLP